MTIQDKVKMIISARLHIPVEDIENDLHLIHDLGANSLDIVILMMAIEDEYSLAVDHDSIQNLGTVSSIISLVEKYRALELKSYEIAV